jgi:hypothetical protein
MRRLVLYHFTPAYVIFLLEVLAMGSHFHYLCWRSGFCALMLVLSVGAVGTAGDPSVLEPVVGTAVVGRCFGAGAEGAVEGVGCCSGGHHSQDFEQENNIRRGKMI